MSFRAMVDTMALAVISAGHNILSNPLIATSRDGVPHANLDWLVTDLLICKHDLSDKAQALNPLHDDPFSM